MTDIGGKSPFKFAAKRYRAAGFMGVLPLPEGQKNPPPTGFTGNTAPYPTDAQVNAWLKKFPRGNIALRLAGVDRELCSDNLPVVYAGNNVDGWELMAIDIDHYGDKKGYDDYVSLAEDLGHLPATAISTARWGTGSGTAVYLVPQGYRFLGKAAKSIDIIQKRHRFTVSYPSINPDANDAMYLWKFGVPSDLVGGTNFEEFEGGLPGLADVTVLPEAWFEHLTLGGMIATDDPISELTLDGLQDWMTERRCWGDGEAHDDGEDDTSAGPCRRMRDAVGNAVAEIDASPSSHDQLAKHHWILINLGAEGHHGLNWALTEMHTAWAKSASDKRGGDPDGLMQEIGRSVYGALSKVQPKWMDYEPDDTCAVGDADATEAWAERYLNEEEAARVAEGDYGGLGPVVGKMALLDTAKPAEEYGQHDYGNAQHIVDLYGANVKFVDVSGSWILWDGPLDPEAPTADGSYGRWHRDTKGDRLIRAAFTRVRMRQEAYARGLAGVAAADPTDLVAKARAKSWTSWAKRSGDLTPIKNALELARGRYVGDESVQLKGNELDGNPVLLGCKNGVMDLNDEDPDVRRPRKEDYVTYNTNIDYVPWRSLAMSENEDHVEAYTIWMDYLEKFLPNEELRLFIRKVCGHLLIGENPEKKVVFLHGPADTGKSTLIGAISGAVGDYAGTVDMSLFKHKDLNPGLARAVPLRIVTMSEMEDTAKNGTIDASVVKRLTGNDMVQAELKYSNDIFVGRPQFTAIIACNNPPTISNADAALYERLLVLPLDHSVDKTKRRYEAQKKISNECGVAVLSWLIEGWKDYQRDGLERDKWPDAVKRANRIFAAGLNNTQEYIAEYLEIARDTEMGRTFANKAMARAKKRNKNAPTAADWGSAWTPEAARVYAHYKAVTLKHGAEPVEMQQFTKDLGVGRTQVRKIDGKATSVYVGVKFKIEPEDDRSASFRVKG